MPPPGLPRPSEAEYQTAQASLTTKLDREAAAQPFLGQLPGIRRLSRTEYQNAIRDLLAVNVDVRSLLPTDELSHGFDNITVANLPPALLEKYLAAARKVSRLALAVPVKAPNGETVTLPPDLTQEDHVEGLPPGTRGGFAHRFTFPTAGEYEIVVRLARDRNEHIEGLREPAPVEILFDNERVLFETVQLPAPGQDHSLVDSKLRLRLRATAGEHTIAATFPRLPALLPPIERQPLPAHFNMDRHPRLTPAIYSITLNGPFNTSGPTPAPSPSRQRLLVCQPTTRAQESPCVQKIYSRLARLAFRRPVQPADTAALRLFTDARRNSSFDEALEFGLRRILVSPEFLFRIERPGDPFALASRLSFFLWSSIPDEPLLLAAQRGELSNPTTLATQVRRMLRDPKAQALTTNFANQWLYLRNLDAASPDMRTFTDFDDNLRQAFRRETELHFAALVREDRSVLDLIRARHTYVNARLAHHYGLPGISGSHFRRVDLPQTSHRGGLLRQGSIHLVTSYPNRTSPVIRGKWILENLLGITPPPPPPDVPALEENSALLQPKTMRERLAAHRRNPACASCHKLMDPVGFALENYDGVGRWRDVEVPDTHFAVDAAGAFPDGSTFTGVEGLEQAILARPEMFVTTLTTKLMTYALGRGVEPEDGPALRQILREATPAQFKFSSIIIGIAKSPAFQQRSTP